MIAGSDTNLSWSLAPQGRQVQELLTLSSQLVMWRIPIVSGSMSMLLGEEQLSSCRKWDQVTGNGWSIVNRTRLPLVCFTPSKEEWDMAMHQRVSDAVVESGRAWISTILLGGKKPALRACITNYRTGPEHIEALIKVLSDVRCNVSAATPSGCL